MYSSGIKRGLAYSAVSALAISGIGLAASASANTINEQANALSLFSPSTNGVVSVKNDGTDTTVRLEAVAPAGITAVNFTYSVNGGAAQAVAGGTNVTRNDDGAFSVEWNVPAGVVGASNVAIAVTDAADAANTSSRTVSVEGGGGAANTVNLTTDGQQGYFSQPYSDAGQGRTTFIASGTTSATTGNVALTTLVPGASSNATAPVSAADGATTGTFAGVLNIAGYPFTGTNQLLVRATNGTEDAEGYTLYSQQIGTVTAVAAQPNAQNSTQVTVTARDQSNAPIAGARVGSSAGGAAQFTDANGQATFTQSSGTSAYYFADATDQAGYQAALNDKRSDDVVVGVSQTSGLQGASADGNAFDLDEYASGDITVQVTDQSGNPVDVTNQALEYYWVVTPFDGSPATERFPAAGNAVPVTAETNGKYIVPLPTATPDASGTYELYAQLNPSTANGTGALPSQKVLTVKAGQAAVTLSPSTISAPAGGDATINGTLALEDGTGLPNRLVRGVYNQGGTGSDSGPDAGFTPATGNGLVSTREYTTDATGKFTSVIDDPAETPQGTEIGGNARYRAIAKPGANGLSPYTDNTIASVDFSSTTPPNGSTVDITAQTAGTYLEPGTAYTGQVTVKDSTGAAVVGQQVTLTTTEGFFTDGTPEVAPVAGADSGALKSLGKTITVTTGVGGVANYQLAIGRNVGFDDDGRVSSTVSAAAGTVTDTETFGFSTRAEDLKSRNAGNANAPGTIGAPLNGGAVDLQVSDDDEQDGPTDPAETGQDVALDVYTTDQFGNLVGGQPVTLSENGDDASIGGTDADAAAGFQALSDYEDDGDATVTSTEDDSVTVTASWATATSKFQTTGSNATVASTETLTDSVTVDFEDITLDQATITSDPEGEVAPGTAVTETLTVLDNNGNPFRNASVTFRVTAPDGSAQEFSRTTNAAGQASIVVVAAQEGTYTVSAQATDGTDTLLASDTITTSMTPEPNPDGTLTGKDNGGKADKLKVETVNVDPGTNVRLYVVKKGGGQKLVKAADLSDNGVIKFKVKDQNGKKVTKYIAKVGAGNDAFFTNTERVR